MYQLTRNFASAQSLIIAGFVYVRALQSKYEVWDELLPPPSRVSTCMMMKSYLRIKSHVVVANGPVTSYHQWRVCVRNAYRSMRGGCRTSTTTTTAPLSPGFLVPVITAGVLLLIACPIVAIVAYRFVRRRQAAKVAQDTELASMGIEEPPTPPGSGENDGYDNIS